MSQQQVIRDHVGVLLLRLALLERALQLLALHAGSLISLRLVSFHEADHLNQGNDLSSSIYIIIPESSFKHIDTSKQATNIMFAMLIGFYRSAHACQLLICLFVTVVSY